eukprot:4689916-Amphidinium_carterae.1
MFDGGLLEPCLLQRGGDAFSLTDVIAVASSEAALSALSTVIGAVFGAVPPKALSETFVQFSAPFVCLADFNQR